jgi:CRP-like cAMP-binding protein/predicted MFS family arabinose efflux permease
MTTRETAGLLSSLRHRDYRLFMAAFTVSCVGTRAYNVALTVWVYDATGSLGWVAATTVCRFVPALLFSVYAGVLADRYEKVGLMVRTDIAFAVIQVAMGVLMVVDGPVVAVLVTAGISSSLGTLYEPAAAGATPLLVPERDLGSANALRNTIDNVTVIAGPALGAFLLLFGPPQNAIWVNAATFLGSAVLVSRIRTRSTAVDVTEGGEVGAVEQMLVGVRAILSSPTVAVMVSYSVLATLVFGIDTVLFVAVSDELLGTGPDGFGYLLAGLGVGGILAAPLVTRVEARPSLGPVILLGMAAYCLPTLILLVNHSPAVAFVVQVVRGAGTLFVDVLAVTAMQRTLPHDVMARVFGVFGALMLAAILIGSTLTSWIVSTSSVEVGVWVASAGAFGISLLGLPWLRQVDALARRRREELAPRIALIEACALFAQVPDGGLAQLAAAAEEVHLAAGTAAVRQGEAADAFYVVEAGTFAVHATTASGERISAPTLGPGQYFGEIGLIEAIPRTADVVAQTDATVLRIDGTVFVEALTTGTPSAAIMDGASVRLGRTHPSLALGRAGLEAGGTA